MPAAATFINLTGTGVVYVIWNYGGGRLDEGR
jgi:hypothetical protein